MTAFEWADLILLTIITVCALLDMWWSHFKKRSKYTRSQIAKVIRIVRNVGGSK